MEGKTELEEVQEHREEADSKKQFEELQEENLKRNLSLKEEVGNSLSIMKKRIDSMRHSKFLQS